MFGLDISNQTTQIYSYNFIINKKKIVDSGPDDYKKTTAWLQIC